MDEPQPPEADGRVPTLAFDVPEFCRAHHIGRSLFYKLRKDGLGPRVMKVGALTRISHEAAAEWRRRMERATEESEAAEG